MPPLTAEQYAMRSRGLGASDVASAIGLSAYQTPLDVYYEKRGLAEPRVESPAMRAGNMLEDAICGWAADELGEAGLGLEPSGTIFHAANDWMFCTPDRLNRRGRRALQAKNVGFRMAHVWGTEPEDVPDEYRVQIEWEMEVADIDICYLAVLIGGQDLRIYPIERNRELCASIVEKARRFWFEHVVPGIPPPIDGSDGTKRRLTDQHPRAGTIRLASTPEAEAMAKAYNAARAQEKAAEAAKAEAGNRLRALIGDADGIAGRWGKATWTNNGNGVPRWKDIAEEMKAPPDLIEKHTPPGARVLRVTLKEKSE